MDEHKNIPQEAVPQGPAPVIPEPPKPAPVRPTWTPPPRYIFPMGKPELVFAAGILLFSLLLCNSLMFAGINLGFALGAAGTILCTLGYLLRRGHRPDRYTAALMVLSLVITAALPRSDDGTLKFLAGCVLLLVPSLAFCLLSGQNLRSPDGITSLLDSPRALFALGVGRIAESGRGIRDACSSNGVVGKKGSSVALGLLIAVPLLAILIPLLMFADAAFEGLLDLLPEIQWHEIVCTLLFGCGFAYVLYTRAAALQHMPKAKPKNRGRRGLNSITVNTVLVSVSFVYVVYLASQLAYFVGGFSGILPENYTLAQYARRGFFEMAWLCAINLGLIALSIGLVSAKETPRLSTRIICLFLGLVTLFLVATASAKMLLYIGSYGLTRLRVLTEVFMVWLALSTVFVCVWLFRSKMAYMKPVVLTALILCAGLLWADVDTQVAKYNVRAYRSGKLETVDVSHLSGLSDGAVPYLYELTKDSDTETAQKARDSLRRRQMENRDLRSWNYASAQAMELMEQFYPEDIGESLGLELAGCPVEILKNTYGSYWSYGEYTAAVPLTPEQAEAAEAGMTGTYWHSGPLPLQLRAVLYGTTANTDYRGPFFTDYDGNLLIPEADPEAFFFRDRAGDRIAPADWKRLHNDYQMNFTLAVYDADTNILYFFMKDT